jgi:pimeloyl-ACP methyl ester carboxylesterase
MRGFLIICFILLSGWHFGQTPVVFVHGMLAGSDTWMNAKQVFSDAGYTDEQLFFYDWNTLARDRKEAGEQFEEFVKQALKASKSKQISLVGHSAGGALCMNFIHEHKLGKRVEKYVHVGSMPISSNPAVPTLNLYSTADLITGGKSYDFENITNTVFENLDHYEIATDSAAIAAMLAFLGEGKRLVQPASLTSRVALGGRVVTMGENEPEAAAQLAFYELNPTTGERQTKTPLATIQTDKNGYWELNILSRGSYIEVMVEAADPAKRKVHYYFECPQEKNDLIYFRTLPTSGFAAILFASLPNNDQPCLVTYSASKALIHGRDTLFVNGQNIITEELANAQKTPIAFFVYTANEKADDLSKIASFGNFPFLSGVNYNFNQQSIDIVYGNKNFTLPALKSKTAIMVKIII